MKRNIENLVKALFHPHTPSSLFVESLFRYAVVKAPHPLSIDGPLARKSPKALALYKRLKPNGAARRAVYVLLALSVSAPELEERLRMSLHRIALGFPVPYFSKLASLRQSLPTHIYHVLQRIYEATLRYRKLVIESAAPQSRTHAYFLQACAPLVKEYEERVVASKLDFLAFHANMYPVYCRLKRVSDINNMLTYTKYSVNAGQSEQPTEMSPCTEFNTVNRAHKELFYELMLFGDVAYRVHNECTTSYLQTGSFCDPFGEYFIKDHVLDYGKVPPIITKELAEKIAYIGKYIYFLRHATHPPKITQLINSLDLSRKSTVATINEILKYTNGVIYTNFIVKHGVVKLLRFIHSVFLCGRGDFIEYLFLMLKESRNSSKKDALAILELALSDAFPNNPLNNCVDIFVKNGGPGEEAASIDLGDAFGLYFRIDHSATLLIEEEFVLKLAYIFKFLWKLKKVEHLARRIASLKYLNFVQRLIFYVFNEAIANFDVSAIMAGWSEKELAIDRLRARLNKQLDTVMASLFLNTQSKCVEYLLYHMERAFVQAGKTGVFDDRDIQSSLTDFYHNTQALLENTYLYNIKDFISELPVAEESTIE